RGRPDHRLRRPEQGRRHPVHARLARSQHQRPVRDRHRDRRAQPGARGPARGHRSRAGRSGHRRGAGGRGQLPARGMERGAQRDTTALVAIDTATGGRGLVHGDPRVDIGRARADPATGKVQAVAANHLREEWNVVDEEIRANLERLAAIGPGEASINTRTLDDRTWIVAYSAAESPVEYYRYDRDGHGNGELTRLFSGRPALEGKPLVPMWPQELTSRDGKTLVSYL